jgi:serine/threonine-protein kinase
VSDADGDAPFVRILDFGIAKVLGESLNASTDLKGTPLYMAPEQIRAKRVSPQTDVWALGLIAYFLLTGKSFWAGAEAESPNMLAVLDEIASSPRARPSARLKEQGLVAAVPPAFDEWLLRCLDIEPTRRFATAGEAVAELELALREGFQLSAGARAAAVSAHSSTELVASPVSPPADRSLTPVQGAPSQPGKSPRALAYGAIAAVVVGLSIVGGRAGDPLNPDDAASSDTIAGPGASADRALPAEPPPVAPANAEPLVASPTASAPAVLPETPQPPSAEPSAKTIRPHTAKTGKKSGRPAVAPSRENPAGQPAKPAATVNAFDLR